WEYQWGDKTVERPVPITRIFAQGGEKDADPRARAAPEFTPYFQGEFKRNPISNLFPSFDIIFVVGVVFSLLIFLLTYDCVSGEREEGTLRVLLSCAVPRDAVLAAKWVGGLISVVIPVAASLTAIALMLVLNPSISIDADTWLRIGAIALLCLLYIAVVFSSSMALSIMSRGSSTAVLVLLLFWVLVIVTIPAMSTPIAHLAVHPSGPHKTEVHMGRVGVVNWNAWHRRSEKQWLELFGRVEYEELTEEQRSKTIELFERNRVPQALFVEGMVDSMVFFGRQATRAYAAVGRTARWIARLSPYGCLQNAATSLAGTGLKHELSLREAMEKYDRAAARCVTGFQRTGAGMGQFDPYTTPSFQSPRTTLQSGLAEAGLDMFLLVLMGLVFSMLAYLAFLRSDIA
ncbi:MAG: ABC transporter permease subunit, partial [Chitinivibrionales bacterium]|nr:ABC transporter permease subunit [Chitinivibrionales bacterium]